MILEKSIHQTKFKSEHHKLMLNIIFTASSINSEQTRFFKKYDISSQQFNVLRILKGQYPNPASVGLLQERMLDQMSNASRLVEKLKQKKLLSRRECKTDRRQVDILITEEGLNLLKEISIVFDEVEKGVNKISIEEAKIMNNILDKMNH